MTPTELAELRADIDKVESLKGSISNSAIRLATPPPLAWTDAKPTVPGWYWIRSKRGEEFIAEVVANRRRGGLVVYNDAGDRLLEVFGQFAGPIPPPDLEAKERE